MDSSGERADGEVALPLCVRGTVASAAPASMNVTDPVGEPPLPLTVAVSVSGAFVSTGLALDANVVEVLAIITVWTEGVDVLGALIGSPANVATRLCAPGASAPVL